MERQGLLETGQKITVTEGLLPSNYYYVIDPALAMSANIPFRNRLTSREGVVTDVVENASTDTAVWDSLAQTGNIILVCRMGITTHRMIDEEMEFYTENHVMVAGAVVFA